MAPARFIFISGAALFSSSELIVQSLQLSFSASKPLSRLCTTMTHKEKAPSQRLLLGKTKSVSRSERSWNSFWMTARAGDAGEDLESISPGDKAVASVERCYKAAFFAFAVNTMLFLTDMDGGIHTVVQTPSKILPLAQTLYRLGLGLGLWQISREYGERRVALTLSYVYSATQTMARLWRQGAWLVAAGAIVMASLISSNAAMLILAVAVAGSAGLRQHAADLAQRAKNETETTATALLNPEADAARAMGVRAARNMMLLRGSFVLLGAVQLLTIIVNHDHATPFGRLVKFLDVPESFGVAGLLMILHRHFLRTLMEGTATTVGNDEAGSKKLSIGDDLYQAQSDFYGKIATVLTTQSVVKLLLYAFRLAKQFRG